MMGLRVLTSPETFTDIITAANQNLSVAHYIYSALSRHTTKKKIVQYFSAYPQ